MAEAKTSCPVCVAGCLPFSHKKAEQAKADDIKNTIKAVSKWRLFIVYSPCLAAAAGGKPKMYSGNQKQDKYRY